MSQHRRPGPARTPELITPERLYWLGFTMLMVAVWVVFLSWGN